ncbi:hypothetical protein MMC18_005475 [Xylographa bjoerkii]|nr:hypothetical protein [Xylographa bjoerkii]
MPSDFKSSDVIKSLQSVLITGCSAGGIGSALVKSFQKRNMHVFATARDPSKMAHLDKLPNVTLLTLDPTSTPSVRAAVESVKTATDGRLDYLVNNAGQTIIMPTLDFDIETAKQMYDVNIWGLLRVTQACAPLLIAAKGTIVNISSISTAVHTPWMGIYAGSKAAVTMITDTLRMELAPFGVKVVTVMTGAIQTKILATGIDFKLPPTSRYFSIEKEIAARARGEDGTPRMAPEVFAAKVVNDVLGGVNGQIWRGGTAGPTRDLTLAPRTLSRRQAPRGSTIRIRDPTPRPSTSHDAPHHSTCMPSRIERTAIRWLLRAALLGTISFAIWGTLSRRYDPSTPPVEQGTPEPHHAGIDTVDDIAPTPEPVAPRGNALVVVSLKEEKVDWLDGILPEWERNVYVVDGEALSEGAKLRIPKNKGREGMVYLSFIIDNYDRLPNVTLFLHSARYQWHNDDPEYDGVPILQNLRLAHVHAEGYANLRCGWTLGCPSEIQPGRQTGPEAAEQAEEQSATPDRTEKYYTEAFQVLFPGEPVPAVVGVGCCAQ